ncbi:LysM peptidoglycan-binding domain-containing protein [Heyndrickxia sp. NPDC080065]|uniref:LysM peptidoglycan-binding domain-containing protein n=1 Tax=Heyndrickxia sp. NPDC080065 TaxID=3390568 RepID=UPI003CFE20D5
MSQSQSSLRFSLEESVWFKKGQEVEELLSISLDPHITIQEQEQYVQIIGSLQLSGEYKGCGEDEYEQELDLHGKFAHYVDYRSEVEVYHFEHRFPVDVTIPKNRIDHLEDIDVNIDAFDYELPEKGKLKLNADLSILGIRNENTMNEEREEEIPISYYPTEPHYQNAAEEVEELEEAELVRAEVEGSQEEVVDRLEEAFQEEFSRSEEESLEIQFEDNFQVPLGIEEESEQEYKLSRLPLIENEHEEIESIQEEDLFQPFIIEARKQPTDQEKEEDFISNENQQDELSINLGMFEANVESSSNELYQQSRQTDYESSNESFNESSAIESSSNEHPHDEDDQEEIDKSQKKKKKKFGKYESISLADFFARKTEEKAAKLKVCIVQHGETLDYLAEKYDINVQQILRMNHLEMNQDVYEGQVLYIPSYAYKKE